VEPEAAADVNDAGNDGGNGSPADVMTSLPRGIAYHLAMLPLLALSPLSTVRKSIEQPRAPALGAWALIGYYLPVFVFSAVVTSWTAGIAVLIAGGGFDVMSFLPIGALAGAVLTSVIGGFLAHPVLRFIVDKLGGHSDARSRTNHVLQTTDGMALLVVPGALAVLVAAIAARLSSTSSAFELLNVLPALLVAVTTPLPVYVAYRWFESFGVAKWFLKVLLVLCALAALSGVFQAGSKIVATVKAMGAPSVDVKPGDVKPSDSKPSDSKPSDVKPPVASTDTKPSDVKPSDTKPVDVKPSDVKPTDTKPSDVKPDATIATIGPDAIKPVATPHVDSKPKPDVPSASYADFQHKHAEIERMLDADPTLVLSDPQVASAYAELGHRLVKAEQVADESVFGTGRNHRRDPGLEKLYARVRDARAYQDAREVVDDLYKRLAH
jgi:hypothetical protein